jgi:hypothetical protein
MTMKSNKKILFVFKIAAVASLVLSGVLPNTARPQTALAQLSVPAITSLSPMSGPVGTQVAILGSGFITNGGSNNIIFDAQPVNGIKLGYTFVVATSSADGISLSLTVPADLNSTIPEPNCNSKAPCPMYYVVPLLPVDPGSYDITVANANGTSSPATFTVSAASAPTNIDPANSNVNINGTVYFLSQSSMPCSVPASSTNTATNQLCTDIVRVSLAYPSAAVFLSYGFNNFANVRPGNPEDLNYYAPYAGAPPTVMAPANGSLVLYSGTVYLVWNGSKIPFTNANAFLGLGYNWNEVISANISKDGDTALQITSETQSHPPGTLINQNGTIYYIDLTGKEAIPSMAVFNSWGFSLNKVVNVNTQDMQLPTSTIHPMLGMRTADQLEP